MTTEEKAGLTCFNTEGITKDEFSITYTCFDTEGITYDELSIKYTCFDTEGITYDGFSIKYTFRYRKKTYDGFSVKYLVLKLAIFIHFCIFFSHITRISRYSNFMVVFYLPLFLWSFCVICSPAPLQDEMSITT
jgi:hypothetical protein